MIRLLYVCFLYIKQFIVDNFLLILFSSITISLLVYGHFLFELEEYENKLEYKAKIENSNKYIYFNINDNNVSSYKITDESNNPIFITSNVDLKYIALIIGYIILVSIILSIISGSADIEFDYANRLFFETLIKCEIEDGIYHYMIFDRLIGKKDYLVDYRISDHFKIYRIKDILNRPKFETKRSRRKKSIKKVLNE